jgi:hypothetical protein
MSDKTDFKIWAFSNENLSFLDKLNFSGTKMCGLAGAGDQAFSFLGLSADSYLGFEQREKAIFFAQFKKAMLKEFKKEKFVSAFKNELSGSEVFIKVKSNLSKEGIQFWRPHLEKKQGFVTSLKKSGLFYNYSFKNFQKRNEFFPYLRDEKNYKNLQENLNSFQMQSSSIQKGLQGYKNKFDFVYLSNILDSPFQNGTYLKSLQPLLSYANESLKKPGGKMIALTLKKKELLSALESEDVDFEVIFEPGFIDRLFFTFGGAYPYSVVLIEPLS